MGLSDVKIFGERNTATNALKALIERNFSAKVLPSISSEIDPHVLTRLKHLEAEYREQNTLTFLMARECVIDRVFANQPPRFAWKHCATTFDNVQCLKDTLVIFCVRNPLSWLHSLYRTPYHIQGVVPKNFGDFLQFQWRLTKRDNLPVPSLTPQQLYEAKIQSYLNCMNQLEKSGISYEVVAFEDMVMQQENVFNRLSELICDPVNNFKIVTQSTKHLYVDIEYYKEYYASERWREELGCFIPDIINILDQDLFGLFGYTFSGT